MIRLPNPTPHHTNIHFSTAQCGTVWGMSSYFFHFTHTGLCQKSVEMLLFPLRMHRVGTNKQNISREGWGKKKKKPPYQISNFCLWTEPLWFLISPMIVAFLHQMSTHPPPPHFRVFLQGRVLFFIKRSEVICLSFQHLGSVLPLTFYLQKVSLDPITHPLAAT